MLLFAGTKTAAVFFPLIGFWNHLDLWLPSELMVAASFSGSLMLEEIELEAVSTCELDYRLIKPGLGGGRWMEEECNPSVYL